ncbi:MAG: hypothetical protein MUQ61_05600, partial [OM182 bacterium]|nr:hypothetical protein [OM182 bacterium]
MLTGLAASTIRLYSSPREATADDRNQVTVMQEEQVAEFMQPRAALASVTPFRVMSVMQRAHELERAGKDIVHLEVGEPDFSTAQPIIDAGKAALDAGRTQYTAATGLEALRNKISERYRKQHGLEISPERILITP